MRYYHRLVLCCYPRPYSPCWLLFFFLLDFFSRITKVSSLFCFFYRFVAEIFNPQFRSWFMRWHATEGKSIFHLSFFRCHVNHNSWLSETKKNGKKDGKMSSLISYFIVHGNSNRTEKVLNLLFMCDFSPSKKKLSMFKSNCRLELSAIDKSSMKSPFMFHFLSQTR